LARASAAKESGIAKSHEAETRGTEVIEWKSGRASDPGGGETSCGRDQASEIRKGQGRPTMEPVRAFTRGEGCIDGLGCGYVRHLVLPDGGVSESSCSVHAFDAD